MKGPGKRKLKKRTSYRITISKTTNITANLSSHFFGFFHGDLKIILAKVQEEKLKERQILQREVIFRNAQYSFRFIVNYLQGAFQY